MKYGHQVIFVFFFFSLLFCFLSLLSSYIPFLSFFLSFLLTDKACVDDNTYGHVSTTFSPGVDHF